MKKLLLLLCLCAVPALLVPVDAQARRGEDDLLEEGTGRSSRGKGVQTAREIVHGFYFKANYGALLWFGRVGAYASPGTAAAFEFGYDIVDQLGMTVSITGTFYQGINNGITYTAYTEAVDNGIADGGAHPVQGDFRSIGGLAGARIGFNPGKRKVRRWTIAVIAKGGVFFSPSLRYEGDGDTGTLQTSPGGHDRPRCGIRALHPAQSLLAGFGRADPVVGRHPSRFCRRSRHHRVPQIHVLNPLSYPPTFLAHTPFAEFLL